MDKITTIYDDYKDITDVFGEKIKARYASLCTMYNSFIKEIGISKEVTINKTALMHAILDYFTDVSRLKNFHQIDLANKYKIRAYEVFWLLKRKVIQIVDDPKGNLAFINEKFILSYTINFIKQELPSDYLDSNDKKSKKKFDGFIETYYYYLKYRNCEPQALELMFLALDAGYTLRELRN